MRKQVNDLTIGDLDFAAMWQFAIDEEGEEDQDECTVRPRNDLTEFVEYEVDIVRTEFITRSGTVYIGFSTPAMTEDLSDMQPVIITEHGMVGFYVGNKPRPGELEKYYSWLNTDADNLFPIQFRCIVAAPGFASSGTIPAFVGKEFPAKELVEFR